jgi:hypothetical protein
MKMAVLDATNMVVRMKEQAKSKVKGMKLHDVRIEIALAVIKRL